MTKTRSMLRDLRDLIDEYERLSDEASAMCDTWNDDNADPGDRAESDPGLQYEASELASEKLDEVKALAREILEED